MHASNQRIKFHALAVCALLAIATFGAAAATPPASTPASSSHSARESAARAQLAGVRAEIANIATAQHATAASRDAINGTLTTQARQLAAAANTVRATDAAIAAKTGELTGLQTQRAALDAKLAGQRAALAELLRAAYTLDRGSDLSLLLGDEDVAKIARALAYSRYFQRNRVARIRNLLGEVAALDATRASIKATTASLQMQRAQLAAQSATLDAARTAQRKLLAAADAQLAQQKDKLAALQRDADALDALLKRLQNVFADIPKQVGNTTPFAQLRGKLPWPVAGKPHGGSGMLASGLVIAAKPGADVHAVAYGRVAWADFMRGYGMLVIIDHGDGWLSLYGGNEAAAVEAGDWVQSGQTIATVGSNSEQGGAWFGLRHDGKPVDPGGWFASRR